DTRWRALTMFKPTPGIIAPLWSVTVPVIDPKVVWPTRRGCTQNSSMAIKKQTVDVLIRISNSSNHQTLTRAFEHGLQNETRQLAVDVREAFKIGLKNRKRNFQLSQLPRSD